MTAPRRKASFAFVGKVTDISGPSYVPPEERIVTSDIDGTLLPERPIYFQVAFMFNQVLAMKKAHPQWKNSQPFKAIIENDKKYLDNLDNDDIKKLFIATQEGMSQEEYQKALNAWIAVARNPRFNARYIELIYQPMRELISYLHANKFRVYLCTGSEIEFVRCFSFAAFNILPEEVIGSSIKYSFMETPKGAEVIGKPGIQYL